MGEYLGVEMPVWFVSDSGFTNGNEYVRGNGTFSNIVITSRGFTPEPTLYPTVNPTSPPTSLPTAFPTVHPTSTPSNDPTSDPTRDPTEKAIIVNPSPTRSPSTSSPSTEPTPSPSADVSDGDSTSSESESASEGVLGLDSNVFVFVVAGAAVVLCIALGLCILCAHWRRGKGAKNGKNSDDIAMDIQIQHGISIPSHPKPIPTAAVRTMPPTDPSGPGQEVVDEEKFDTPMTPEGGQTHTRPVLAEAPGLAQYMSDAQRAEERERERDEKHLDPLPLMAVGQGSLHPSDDDVVDDEPEMGRKETAGRERPKVNSYDDDDGIYDEPDEFEEENIETMR